MLTTVKKYKILVLSTALTLPLITSQTLAASLPDAVAEALNQAYKTGNPYIIDAVKDKAVNANPKLAEAIMNYTPSAEATADAEPETPKAESPWKAQLESGLSLSSGNSENTNIRNRFDISHESKKWLHEVGLRANFDKDSNTTTTEEYRAEGQSNYKIDDKNYVFGNIGYVNDRFSGYNYRISETVGYGRKILDTDTHKLNLEASLGARQSEDAVTEDTSNEFIQRLGGDYEWHITDGITFTQDLQIERGSDNTITNSETALKTNVYENLFLKTAFEVEHQSEVPAGRENTDTLTSINFVYDF